MLFNFHFAWENYIERFELKRSFLTFRFYLKISKIDITPLEIFVSSNKMIFTVKLRTFNILKCYPTYNVHLVVLLLVPHPPQQSCSFLNKTEKVSRAPTFLFFHPFSCPSTDTISGYNVREEMALKKRKRERKKTKRAPSRSLFTPKAVSKYLQFITNFHLLSVRICERNGPSFADPTPPNRGGDKSDLQVLNVIFCSFSITIFLVLESIN